MPGSLGERLALSALRALPRNLVSRGAGRVAGLRLPHALRRPACLAFGRSVGVDFDEVRDPLDSFPSLQAFFTRALREGVRPLDPAPDALLSPCDGTWGAAGRVTQGLLLQLKGRPYRLAALLGDEEDARTFEGGCFATLYLSPRDYHRFHTPCAVQVVAARAIPGTLWPVNPFGVTHVDGLFAENERICAFFDVASPGAGRLCLVAVGATLVGKVRVTFDALETNRAGARTIERRYGSDGARYDRGAEWGRFEFGSTLILLAAPGTATLESRPPGSPLRLGTRIGSLDVPGRLATGASEANVTR